MQLSEAFRRSETGKPIDHSGLWAFSRAHHIFRLSGRGALWLWRGGYAVATGPQGSRGATGRSHATAARAQQTFTSRKNRSTNRLKAMAFGKGLMALAWRWPQGAALARPRGGFLGKAMPLPALPAPQACRSEIRSHADPIAGQGNHAGHRRRS
jgi:hypothetical protein